MGLMWLLLILSLKQLLFQACVDADRTWRFGLARTCRFYECVFKSRLFLVILARPLQSIFFSRVDVEALHRLHHLK